MTGIDAQLLHCFVVVCSTKASLSATRRTVMQNDHHSP
jgi:hypothetical protein